MKNPTGPSKQPKQVKLAIHRTGRTTPVSAEKIKKNREVKISVVPDRAKRDLTKTLNGPVAQMAQKSQISPSKGVSIKIENEPHTFGLLSAENNNFWTGRPVLPGVVNTPSQLPQSGLSSTSTSKATSSVSSSNMVPHASSIAIQPGSISRNLNDHQLQGVQVQNSAQSVGIPVVVQVGCSTKSFIRHI